MDTTKLILEIAEIFQFKNNKTKPPEIYLGGKLENKNINGLDVCTLTSRDYINAIVEQLEEQLTKMGTKLTAKVTTPIRNNYKPELDETNEVEHSELTMY